jgi:hypothetical protein
LNDDALKILSGLFFEPYGHMEAARRSVLRGRTTGKVFEEFVGKSDSVRDALVLLSNTVGVSFLRLREYYSTADMATKKLFAAILFQNKYMGDFSECVVEIGSSLDALLVPPPVGKTTAMTPDVSALQQQVGRLVDMSFLTPLVVPQNEKFLVPAAVYARDCMRTIFDLFRDDAGGEHGAGQQQHGPDRVAGGRKINSVLSCRGVPGLIENSPVLQDHQGQVGTGIPLLHGPGGKWGRRRLVLEEHEQACCAPARRALELHA